MGGILQPLYPMLFFFALAGMNLQEDPGEQLLFEERFLDALTFYQTVLAKNPENAKTYLSLGEAQEGLFRYRDAYETYKKALQRLEGEPATGPLKPSEQELKGILKQRRMDLKPYMSSLKLAEKTEEEYLSLLIRLARGYLKAGWRDAAEDALRDAILLRPDEKEARELLVQSEMFHVTADLLLGEEGWETLPGSEKLVGWQTFGPASWVGGRGFLKGDVKGMSQIVQDEILEGGFSVFARMHLLGTTGYAQEFLKGGVVFGYTSPQGFYLMELWKDSVRLLRFVGSTWISMEEQKLASPIPVDRWFDFQLIVLPEKRAVHAVLDGKHVFSTTVQDLPRKGRIGFRAEACVATIQRPRLLLLRGSPWVDLLWRPALREEKNRIEERRDGFFCPPPLIFPSDGQESQEGILEKAKASLAKGIECFDRKNLDEAETHFNKALLLFWRGYQDSPAAHLYLAQIEESKGKKREAHSRLLRLLRDETIPSKSRQDALRVVQRVDLFPKEFSERTAQKKKLMNILFSLGKRARRADHFVLARQCGRKLSALEPRDRAVLEFTREVQESWLLGTLEGSFPPWEPLFSGDSLEGWIPQTPGWQLFKNEACIAAKGAAYLTWKEDFSADFGLSARIRTENPEKEFGAGLLLGFKGLHEFYLVKWNRSTMRFFLFAENRWSLLLESPLEKGVEEGKDSQLNILVQEKRGRIFFLKDGEPVACWRGTDGSFRGKVGVFVESGTLRLKSFSSKRRF